MEPVTISGSDWGYPISLHALGSGACSGRSGQDIVDQIVSASPGLADIDEPLLISPGEPMSAGAGMLADPVPSEAEAQAARRFLVLATSNAFGVVFYRSDDCAVGICDQGEYFYFQTDADCRPRQVGRYSAVVEDGCLLPSGQPLWGWPSPLGPFEDCTADLSPQDITGSYRMRSFGRLGLCGEDLEIGDGAVAMLDVTLTIAQGEDLATATVKLEDTGSAWIDSVSIEGTVARKWVHAHYDEVLDGPCPVRRTHRLDIDAEQAFRARDNHLFGIFEVMETLEPGCAEPSSVCVHALQGHLMGPSP